MTNLVIGFLFQFHLLFKLVENTVCLFFFHMFRVRYKSNLFHSAEYLKGIFVLSIFLPTLLLILKICFVNMLQQSIQSKKWVSLLSYLSASVFLPGAQFPAFAVSLQKWFLHIQTLNIQIYLNGNLLNTNQ